MLGVHPASSEQIARDDNWEDQFKLLVSDRHPYAIGKCGLDRKIKTTPQIKKWMFSAQICNFNLQT